MPSICTHCEGLERKVGPEEQAIYHPGIQKDEFSYLVWDLAKKKIIWSRDIVFMEEKTIID